MTPPERQKELLRRLAEQTITMVQFLEECYHWALETSCLVDIETRQYPPVNKAYQEYEALPIDKRYKIGEAFFRQPDIKGYLFQRGKVYSENYSDYCWLSEIKKYMPIGEAAEDKLYSLKLWLKGSTPELENLTDTFGGRIVESRNRFNLGEEVD